MVKCYACGKRFESGEDFYRHAVEEHGSVENTIYEVEERKVTPEELNEILKDVDKLAGFIEAQYENGILRIKKLRGVANPNYRIDVWNCTGTLLLKPDDDEDTVAIGYFRVPRRIYRPEIEKELEELCWQVLEDRGGAINMSGIYYLDEEHVRKLRDVVGFIP